MNTPNETFDMSSAADEYSVALDNSVMPSIDLQQTVADHPMTSALIAAAAGAGLMGLLTLAMRSGGAATASAAVRSAAQSLPDMATRSDFDNLRDQLSKWAKDLLDSAPSKADAKRAVQDARHDAGDTWSEVRDQATALTDRVRAQVADTADRVRSQVADTADRMRPKVTAAVEVAKENPVWLGAAIAALGVIAGASALASSRK